ncbi:MAG: hypothetical protein WCT18_04355 [Patescibacteria group bacterium]
MNKFDWACYLPDLFVDRSTNQKLFWQCFLQKNWTFLITLLSLGVALLDFGLREDSFSVGIVFLLFIFICFLAVAISRFFNFREERILRKDVELKIVDYDQWSISVDYSGKLVMVPLSKIDGCSFVRGYMLKQPILSLNRNSHDLQRVFATIKVFDNQRALVNSYQRIVETYY